jgi:hypothetical protein
MKRNKEMIISWRFIAKKEEKNEEEENEEE